MYKLIFEKYITEYKNIRQQMIAQQNPQNSAIAVNVSGYHIQPKITAAHKSIMPRPRYDTYLLSHRAIASPNDMPAVASIMVFTIRNTYSGADNGNLLSPAYQPPALPPKDDNAPPDAQTADAAATNLKFLLTSPQNAEIPT